MKQQVPVKRWPPVSQKFLVKHEPTRVTYCRYELQQPWPSYCITVRLMRNSPTWCAAHLFSNWTLFGSSRFPAFSPSHPIVLIPYIFLHWTLIFNGWSMYSSCDVTCWDNAFNENSMQGNQRIASAYVEVVIQDSHILLVRRIVVNKRVTECYSHIVVSVEVQVQY